MMKSAAIAIITAVIAYGQAVRVDPVPVLTTSGTVPIGSYLPVLAVPGASIVVCTYPSCSSIVTTYTDSTGSTACPSSAQVVWAQSVFCTSTTDQQGNFGFWVTPGNYMYQIQYPNGQTFGPFAVSAGGSGGSGGGYVVDTSYGTLALGCAAAGSSGTLAITKLWTLVPTTNLTGCSVLFFGLGRIQPAGLATVTMGTFSCPPAQQCFDYQRSGSIALPAATPMASLQWFGAGFGGSDDGSIIGKALTSGALNWYAIGPNYNVLTPFSVPSRVSLNSSLATTSFTTTATGSLITFSAVSNGQIIRIHAVKNEQWESTDSSSIAFTINDSPAVDTTQIDLQAEGFYTALFLSTGVTDIFRHSFHVNFNDNKRGIVIQPSGGHGINGNTFTGTVRISSSSACANISAYSGTRYVLSMSGSNHGNVFDSMMLEGNGECVEKQIDEQTGISAGLGNHYTHDYLECGSSCTGRITFAVNTEGNSLEFPESITGYTFNGGQIVDSGHNSINGVQGYWIDDTLTGGAQNSFQDRTGATNNFFTKRGYVYANKGLNGNPLLSHGTIPTVGGEGGSPWTATVSALSNATIGHFVATNSTTCLFASDNCNFTVVPGTTPANGAVCFAQSNAAARTVIANSEGYPLVILNGTINSGDIVTYICIGSN